jgi:hypothetical protein
MTWLMQIMIEENFLASEVLALTDEEPTYAVELATYSHSKEKWWRRKCDTCGYVLVTLCSEGKWNCKARKCEEEFMRQNWCLVCCEFGTMRRRD